MRKISKFINLCKMTQIGLKLHLGDMLSRYYSKVVYEDGFIYVKGNEPVLLTAHMDTVHKHPVKKVIKQKTKGKTKISSPQGIGGDDRCGIYMILNILETTDYRPSILFCEDEEIGGVGSDKFCASEYAEDLKELKFLIELDRANAKDAVFYDCGNKDFQKFITKTTGFKEEWGSFSDISNLSPATDVASVNLSCGYYKAHTLEEYVIFEEMQASIGATKKLIAAAKEVDKFDYQEIKYSYSRLADWCDNYYYGNSMYGMEFLFYEGDKEGWDCVDGTNEMECLGAFMLAHPTLRYNDILDMQPYYYDSITKGDRYGDMCIGL